MANVADLYSELAKLAYGLKWSELTPYAFKIYIIHKLCKKNFIIKTLIKNLLAFFSTIKPQIWIETRNSWE